jgi:hypothetical protein
LKTLKILLLPFPICIFCCCCCLTLVVMISNTVLNRSGECRHPWLGSNLRGKGFDLSSLSILLLYGLYYAEKHSFYTNLFRVFITEKQSFVNCFFCLYWDAFLLLLSVNGSAQHSLICMLNYPCIPGMNLTWLWCVIL